MVDKPQFGFCVELLEHFWHCAEDRYQLVKHPRLVDPHANQKHDKVALHLCGHSVFVDHMHPIQYWKILPARRK